MFGNNDPFARHPALKTRIADPLTSYFRTFQPGDLDEMMKARGMPSDWRRSDEEIEASRRSFLDSYGGGDLWVFGYGSLMWDPAIRFSEVRRARIIGYARRFCLRDTLGGRGTPEAPGLMVALDSVANSEGPQCEGLAFRIAGEMIEEETGYLWRREYIVPAYQPVIARAETAPGPLRVLAFAADHDSHMIRPDISRQEQVGCIVTGRGFLGTSLEYLENLHAHFSALGIEDPEIAGLLKDVEACSEDPGVSTRA